MRPLQILTWSNYPRYLASLARTGHELLLPVKPGHPIGYAGRADRPFPGNVRDVPAEEVPGLQLDVVLSQSRQNWLVDRDLILSDAQRLLPRVHLEHDPPREHGGGDRHVVDDPGALLVHVTHFNELMWDSGATPTRVIEHGVALPMGVRWHGRLQRGLVIVNGLGHRGRWVGADLVQRVRRAVPVDLVGIGTEELGGLGEIPHAELPAFAANYRFLFHPVRYAGLGIAVCEAMLLGMPVVGLATTELATIITNGVSGWVGTDLDWLTGRMRSLLEDHEQARRLGEGARRTATHRFAIERFTRDWDEALTAVTTRKPLVAANA